MYLKSSSVPLSVYLGACKHIVQCLFAPVNSMHSPPCHRCSLSVGLAHLRNVPFIAHVLQSVFQENKAPEAETSRLHVGHLTRNVQQEHIHEIFSTFGTVKHVELAMDKAVNLPRGFAYVELSKRSEAEEAQRLMDGGQLDGNQLRHAMC